jgi:hypothetical protein
MSNTDKNTLPFESAPIKIDPSKKSRIGKGDWLEIPDGWEPLDTEKHVAQDTILYGYENSPVLRRIGKKK